MKADVSSKYIIRTALPISLAMMIPLVNNLTNNFFLGQVGTRELAVNGVAGVFYLLLSMVGYGLASGIQVQFSRRAAVQDYDGIARIFISAAMLTTFISLSLMMVSMWAAPVIFGLTLHSDEHIVLSINYLFIRVWGLPFLMLTQLANTFYISTNRSQYLMWGALVATLVNIALDYALILGHWGAPKMGIEGAAIASLIAEICGCAMMWGLFFARRLHYQFPIARYFTLDLSQWRKMLVISAPLIFQYFFSIGGWLVFFIYVEHLGEPELAASQILRSIFSFIGIFAWAFATTTSTLVSNIIGQGRKSEVLPLVHRIAGISIVFSGALSVLLFFGARYYLSLFTHDESLILLGIPSLRVIAVASLLMAVSTVTFNAVVGIGRTMINLITEVICVSCYLVYCTIFIEHRRLPLVYAWMSEFVYWTTLLIISYTVLRIGKWKRKVAL